MKTNNFEYVLYLWIQYFHYEKKALISDGHQFYQYKKYHNVKTVPKSSRKFVDTKLKAIALTYKSVTAHSPWQGLGLGLELGLGLWLGLHGIDTSIKEQ